MNQEQIALFIVALAFIYCVWGVVRNYALESLSFWLLRRQQVKWAMRVRGLSLKRPHRG